VLCLTATTDARVAGQETSFFILEDGGAFMGASFLLLFLEYDVLGGSFMEARSFGGLNL
jgi:hypothetical protein